jgi:ribonuclease R
MNIDPESLLFALRGARGKGLSLKQLAGQLRLGQAQKDPLRRALSHLLKQGRASYDGHLYRERQGQQGQNGERPKGGDGERPMASKEPRRDQPRRASAVMAEGARRRREQGSGRTGRKPGGEVTGVIHLKPEGYGFITPLLGEGGRDNDLFVPPQYTKGALDGDVVRARVIRGRDARLAAEVVEIVERRRQLVLGIYQAKGKVAWVIPHDRNLTGNIAVPRHPRARDGEM